MAHRTHHDAEAPAALAHTRAILGGASPVLRPAPIDAKMQHLLLMRPVDLELDAQSFRALWPDDYGPQFYFAHLAPPFFARLLASARRTDSGKFILPAAHIPAAGEFPRPWERPALDFWLLETDALVECRVRAPGGDGAVPPQFRQPREGAGPFEVTAVASPCPHCGRTAKHRRLKQVPSLICQACGRTWTAG